MLDEPTAVLLPEEIGGLLAVCERVAASGCGVVLVTHKLAEIEQRGRPRHGAARRPGGGALGRRRPTATIDRLVRAMIAARRSSGSLGAPARRCVGAVAATRARRRRPGRTRPAAACPKRRSQLDGADRPRRGRRRPARRRHAHRQAAARSSASPASRATARASSARCSRGMTRGRARAVSSSAARESDRPLAEEITAAGVGIVPEDRHARGLHQRHERGREPVSEPARTRFTPLRAVRPRRALSRAAAALMTRFDVRAARPGRRRSASLSGGNQQKAVLARELTVEPLVFLLAAQPTRGLDVGAVRRSTVRSARRATRGVGVLLISSELDELIAVADRIVVLYRGRIIGEMRARRRATASHRQPDGGARRMSWPALAPCRASSVRDPPDPGAARRAVVGPLIGVAAGRRRPAARCPTAIAAFATAPGGSRYAIGASINRGAALDAGGPRLHLRQSRQPHQRGRRGPDRGRRHRGHRRGAARRRSVCRSGSPSIVPLLAGVARGRGCGAASPGVLKVQGAAPTRSSARCC